MNQPERINHQTEISNEILEGNNSKKRNSIHNWTQHLFSSDHLKSPMAEQVKEMQMENWTRNSKNGQSEVRPSSSEPAEMDLISSYTYSGELHDILKIWAKLQRTLLPEDTIRQRAEQYREDTTSHWQHLAELFSKKSQKSILSHEGHKILLELFNHLLSNPTSESSEGQELFAAGMISTEKTVEQQKNYNSGQSDQQSSQKAKKFEKGGSYLDHKGRKMEFSKLDKTVKRDKFEEGVIEGTITTQDMINDRLKMTNTPSDRQVSSNQIGGSLYEPPVRGEPGDPSEQQRYYPDMRAEANNSSRAGDLTGYQKRPGTDQTSNKQFDMQTREFHSLIRWLEQKSTRSYIERSGDLSQNFRDENLRIRGSYDNLLDNSKPSSEQEELKTSKQVHLDTLEKNYRLAVAKLDQKREIQQQMMAAVRKLFRLAPRG